MIMSLLHFDQSCKHARPSLLSLLFYLLGDLLGMLAVGHPTSFGVWTLVGCALVSLVLFALTSVKRGSKPQRM